MDLFHVCDRGARRSLYDARGIFCCYICPVCEDDKRARWRPEVLTDPAYEAEEAIDDE